MVLIFVEIPEFELNEIHSGRLNATLYHVRLTSVTL